MITPAIRFTQIIQYGAKRSRKNPTMALNLSHQEAAQSPVS
jgi:hypothetical protein